MEWTVFTPVKIGEGPKGVCDETHRIQYLGENGRWAACDEPQWFTSGKYRYRLRTPDLTQLSGADLAAQAQAIEAERKRRDDDLGECLELLAKVLGVLGFPNWVRDLREGVVRETDKTAARIMRDHTLRAVDVAPKATGQ